MNSKIEETLISNTEIIQKNNDVDFNLMKTFLSLKVNLFENEFKKNKEFIKYPMFSKDNFMVLKTKILIYFIDSLLPISNAAFIGYKSLRVNKNELYYCGILFSYFYYFKKTINKNVI